MVRMPPWLSRAWSSPSLFHSTVGWGLPLSTLSITIMIIHQNYDDNDHSPGQKLRWSWSFTRIKTVTIIIKIMLIMVMQAVGGCFKNAPFLIFWSIRGSHPSKPLHANKIPILLSKKTNDQIKVQLIADRWPHCWHLKPLHRTILFALNVAATPELITNLSGRYLEPRPKQQLFLADTFDWLLH